MVEKRPKDIPKLKGYKPTRFMLPESRYDRKKADRAVDFIECLRHTKGVWAAKRFWLFPWQEQIVRDVFGVVDKKTGRRQFKTAYVEIPKKNGKSELAAAIALYLLYADGEQSAEVYGAAADRQQASIVFDVAKDMAEYSPAIMKRSKVMGATKRIVNYMNRGFYQVLSAEVGCLAPDTPIQMGDGTVKRADEVRAGDVILAYDGLAPVFDRVKSARREPAAPMVAVKTAHGREIATTENHPFYRLEGGSYEWAAASELRPGDVIAARDGEDAVAEAVPIGDAESVSFEMETYQTHDTAGLITHNTKHGFNVSGLVFDELHTQPNRKLYDVLTKGSGDAREQPFYFLITTAGTDRESICYEVHQKAKDILAGRKADPTFYPVIYGLDDGEDWTKEENWFKANPSLGLTVKLESVRDMFRDAMDNPAEENVFKQLRLNMWVSSLTQFIPDHVFARGNDPIDTGALAGRECYGGLDLSSTDDVTAFVLVFPPPADDPDGQYVVLPYFWIPEDTVPVRVRRASVPYDVWVQQGLMYATEGNVVHYGFIEEKIRQLGETYHIMEISFDRWGATQMSQDLTGMGFTVVPMGQGFASMSPPTKEFYKLLMEGRIRHGGNPVLRWMAGNVVVDTDPAGNIKPTKQKSTEKIDGIVAAVMALDRCIRHDVEAGSVYDDEDRGLISF